MRIWKQLNKSGKCINWREGATVKTNSWEGLKDKRAHRGDRGTKIEL